MDSKRFLKNHFKQFNFNLFLSEVLLKIYQRIFSPLSRFFYSQTGEDIILLYYLSDKKIGFYVEVGCNKPIEKSNSFLFYKMGWRGICIDPNNELINKFKSVRPNDICINLAVSPNSGEVILHEFENSEVSTISDSKLSEWKKNWAYKGEKKVKSEPLNKILEENFCPLHFDFLSIDVEGYDFEVLKTIDLNIYWPFIIIIEIHDFSLEKLLENEIYLYLSQFNYELISFATMNAYFRKKIN